MKSSEFLINEQIHLSLKDTINLGSFYTPNNLVKLVINTIKPYYKNISSNKVVILDSSAGYGAFLEEINQDDLVVKANDIDQYAYNILKIKFKDVYNFNALYQVNRSKYNILKDDFLIIIGNPPYNDRTSYAKHNQKDSTHLVDKPLHSRDLGISFLKSYNYLSADIICVLHPFAYLAKLANFKQLKEFTKNYQLKHAIIFNSNLFLGTSKATQFPICIALYIRNSSGMNHDYIKEFNFKILDEENSNFKLVNLDSIANYVGKYPKKDQSPIDLYFYTLRDINALKRNKTFLFQRNSGVIPVSQDNLYWYCYIDVFKEFSHKLPYYYGNCDVFVDNIEYKKIADSFFLYSFINNKVLNSNTYAKSLYEKLKNKNTNFNSDIIQYFMKIFLKN